MTSDDTEWSRRLLEQVRWLPLMAADDRGGPLMTAEDL